MRVRISQSDGIAMDYTEVIERAGDYQILGHVAMLGIRVPGYLNV